MEDAAHSVIRAWEPFYVVVGTSAGALTGLQFVVLTLISEGGTIRGSGATLAAFGSPTVVHFCTALLVSAVMSAPWIGYTSPGIAVALCGVGGLVYGIVVLRRALRQTDYKPVMEDWIWHTTLPLLAYAAMVFAGLRLPADPDMLYVIGAATLLLVFIGIHNAWDTVMYVLFDRAREQRAAREREQREREAKESAVMATQEPTTPATPQGSAPSESRASAPPAG